MLLIKCYFNILELCLSKKFLNYFEIIQLFLLSYGLFSYLSSLLHQQMIKEYEILFKIII